MPRRIEDLRPSFGSGQTRPLQGFDLNHLTRFCTCLTHPAIRVSIHFRLPYPCSSMTPHVNPQDGRPTTASAAALTRPGKAFTARTALVIWTLMLVNALAQFDRQLVSMMAESLKAEFSLADWQLGLMTGFSFAVLYGAVSLPIAYMSDRTNRMQVIAACVGLGGLFIAFAGAAQTFIQLFLARVIVGGAEAGGSAASQSLIGSLARREKRATALGVYGAGIPVGTFVGLLVGGMVIDSGDWRTAVAIAGVTGLAVSLALAVLSRGAEFAPVARSPRQETSGAMCVRSSARRPSAWSQPAAA